jgi:hypothetical protein
MEDKPEKSWKKKKAIPYNPSDTGSRNLETKISISILVQVEKSREMIEKNEVVKIRFNIYD